MVKLSDRTSFGELFKKYRLRSEISTLSEFGDLLAEEGLVYETSLFTRWQNGERVPRERKTLLAILKVFSKKEGLQTILEANLLLDAAGHGYLTASEQQQLSNLQDGISSNILQASLGGLLKDYRTQKNISLNEVAFGIGWKDKARLNNIEQGLEKPSRELIDEICRILDLKEQEKNYLLLVGNYLPTWEEIEIIRKKVQPIIDEWPYAAVLIDFSWRVLLVNEKKAKIFHLREKEHNEMLIKMPRIIEVLFHPYYVANVGLKGKELEEWYNWLVELLVHFRYAQQNRTKENWYIELISNMMDNKLFSEMWKKSYNLQMFKVAKHGKKVLIHPHDKNKRLLLYFSVVPLLSDPRFEIEFCTPVDSETFNYFQ